MHNRLAGATVVVTRPAASAAPIKRRVRQLGGTALSLPGTTLRKAGDAEIDQRLHCSPRGRATSSSSSVPRR